MKIVTKEELEKVLKGTNGKFFGVVFTKKNGDLRHLFGRLGVKKGVTGKGLAYDPAEYDLLPVYDMKIRAFRMIRLSSIKAVAFQDKTYFTAN